MTSHAEPQIVALPEKYQHSRAPKPLGSISIVRNGSGRPGRRTLVRRIKIRMDGPKSRRWMDYALWWWLQNRGRVPEGKRVCHLDGDTLNDDPSNLGLLTAGDVVFLAHERDPAMSRENFRKLRKATARFNRDRAIAERAMRWLPSAWYAVDFGNRVVRNDPRRQRWEIYRMYGFDCGPENWRTSRPAVLGFAGRTVLGALVLTALAERGPMRLGDVCAAVAELRRHHGWGHVDPDQGSIVSAVCALRHAVVRQRDADGRRIYRISQGALAARGKVCPVIAVRGSSLANEERFAGFSRTIETFRPVKLRAELACLAGEENR